MNANDTGFEDEFAFFDAATADADVYRSYHTWMRQSAADEIDRMIRDGRAPRSEREALIAVGMEPFDKAFKAYRRRNDIVPRDFPFSTYYRWWARQYATMHLARGSGE